MAEHGPHSSKNSDKTRSEHNLRIIKDNTYVKKTNAERDYVSDQRSLRIHSHAIRNHPNYLVTPFVGKQQFDADGRSGAGSVSRFCHRPVNTHTHTYTHTRTHTHIETHTHMPTLIRKHKDTHTHTHTQMHANARTHRYGSRFIQHKLSHAHSHTHTHTHRYGSRFI
jgi:hypothetical protein